MKAWHFVGDTLRDGRPVPPDGEWLAHKGEVVPCRSGLHASARIIDALKYAPGSTVCRVELRGDLQSHGNPVDKWAGRERRILWRVDADELLRDFARRCALDVVHLQDAVVVRYLRTGDESSRVASLVASWVASASWDASWDASWATHNRRLTAMVVAAHKRQEGDDE